MHAHNLHIYFLRYPARGILIVVMIGCCCMAFQVELTQENNRPVVRILSPKRTAMFQWNKDIPYVIQVTDKEDGNSAYDEIENQQVLLKVSYLADSTQVSKYLKAMENEEEPLALSLMKTSTCFNCHTSRSILIGPSFDRIALRYIYNESNVNDLVSKVLSGSKGTWGEVQMPSNTDLKKEEIEVIVHWILKYNLNPNEFYQSGLKGTFRMKEETVKKDSEKGVVVLTASYSDHGVAGNLNLKKRGQHSLVLKLN